MVQLQVELQRMNVENQKLKEMLSQVSNNYNALQMHLMAVMQHQQQNIHRADTTQQLQVIDQLINLLNLFHSYISHDHDPLIYIYR